WWGSNDWGSRDWGLSERCAVVCPSRTIGLWFSAVDLRTGGKSGQYSGRIVHVLPVHVIGAGRLGVVGRGELRGSDVGMVLQRKWERALLVHGRLAVYLRRRNGGVV